MQNHPSFLRAMAAARSLGSTATTVRGVAKFITGINRKTWRIEPSPKNLSRTEWQWVREQRKADPDAKRARDDKAFRAKYLAALRRREKKALACDTTTLQGLLERIDTEQDRNAELAEVARLRSIATATKCKPHGLPGFPPNAAKFMVNATVAKRVKAPVVMRGKDASVSPCWAKSFGHHQEAYTEWKKGKPRGVRAVHDNYVRSFGVIESPQRLACIFHETQVTIDLPHDYEWRIDTAGIKAVCVASPQDDYHPWADDLLRASAAAIVEKLESNRRRRQMAAAQQAVDEAAVKGVYVCLADSLRAGNCRAGTLAFGERHGLDKSQHYSAPELLRIANGDANRVRLAVTAARLRHEREIECGFCLLAEHSAE